jgi:hypothetical protein
MDHEEAVLVKTTELGYPKLGNPKLGAEVCAYVKFQMLDRRFQILELLVLRYRVDNFT